jgi:hypothetical protein
VDAQQFFAVTGGNVYGISVNIQRLNITDVNNFKGSKLKKKSKCVTVPITGNKSLGIIAKAQ